MRAVVLAILLILAHSPALAKTPFTTQVDPAWFREVMPSAETFADKSGDPPVIRGYRTRPESGERELVGFLFFSKDLPPEEKGYSAPIDMLIGLGTDGRLTGLKVLNYVESYRYSRGDFLAREGFQEQFRDKPINDEFRVRRDLDGVSNATISSWAIARTARTAARKVATAYLQYEEGDQLAKQWAANAREQLDQWSWQDLLDRGMVAQGQVATPVGEPLQLSIAYMGRRVLGEYLVGDAYEKAERDASIRFDTPEMLLFAVGGESSQYFRQERLALQQGDAPPRRIHPRRIVNAGNADQGAIAGHATFAGAVVLEGELNLSQPFAVVYQPLGGEDLHLEYQLDQLSLAISRDEPILSLEEIEKARLAEAGLFERLRHDPPWGETPWAKVAMLLMILALVMAAFLRKSSALRWTALTLTLVYLGFVDGGFLSVSHLTGVIMQGPEILLNNLPALLIVTFTLVTTLLWGRVFCSSLCPFGAVQDFISRFVPQRWQRFKVPQVLHDRALYIKYGILALILGSALVQSQVSIFQYFEPFGTLFFFSSSVLLWTILIAILAGSVFIPRFYCRYLCPLGAALGVVSLVSPFRIKRVPQCEVCKVCENACPTGAIRGPQIDFKECVRCDICESKLIEKAGSCRHSIEEIQKRQKKAQVIAVDTSVG
ncbi:4Fe-4S binding protein [Gilvimarinus sp. F26214L]|uniref:4Fe-4S binding protein n=1 Tax=Gilvimarinus sp. DZF01 TaxID=3461371 RepID=UPI0040461AB4